MDDFKTLLESSVKKAAAEAGRKPGKAAAAEAKPAAPEAVAVLAMERSAAQETGAGEPGQAGVVGGEGESKAAGKDKGQRDSKGPQGRPASNLNRITVNLFDADRRALAVIKEKLEDVPGVDFVSRSDSIKIALRLAMKSTGENLARVYGEVKKEDRRFRRA